MALSYAADGDVELSLKIAQRIERMAPESPRYRQLRAYLDEETARRKAKALTGKAGDQLSEGDLEAALASVSEALAVYPSHQAAREIRDRVTGILMAQGKLGSTPVPGPPDPTPEPVAPAPEPQAAEPAAAPPPEALTPLPEGAPQNAEAAALVDLARRLLRGRDPQGALPLLEQAAQLEPQHAGLARLLNLTRAEAKKDQVETLTTAALDHFVRNDYRKARKAVEQALALDPANRKARELQTILGALG
jgi:tetratricopeptide (TPR) repeat protein